MLALMDYLNGIKVISLSNAPQFTLVHHLLPHEKNMK